MMTHIKLLAAAAVLSTAIASPVMARDYVRTDRHVEYHQQHDGGFWPAEAAAGIVGGAIGAAGAIATAPFRDNYAYDNTNAYNDSYAQYNGPYEQGYDDSYASFDRPNYGYSSNSNSSALSRIGSGASASFGDNGGGTRSPGVPGDIGN